MDETANINFSAVDISLMNLKVYAVSDTLSFLTLLNGCENGTLQKKYERRMETANIKFLRSVSGCALYKYKRK